MTATFAFSDRILETAIIYVNDVEYDRVSVDTLEYVIDDYDYDSDVITIVYTDGTTTNDPITIVPFEKLVINNIRGKITQDSITSAAIIDLLDTARREVIIDLCKYYYGIELIWIREAYYKLPNSIYLDYNGGGEISTYDIEFYSQTIPIYEYTTKDAVTVVAMNAKDRWVQLDAKLAGSQILKANYYGLQRELKNIDLIELISLRILYNYYQDAYNNLVSSSSSTANKIKVGDITIENTASSGNSTTAFYVDRLLKTNARYTDKIEKFKKGFYRLH